MRAFQISSGKLKYFLVFAKSEKEAENKFLEKSSLGATVENIVELNQCVVFGLESYLIK